MPKRNIKVKFDEIEPTEDMLLNEYRAAQEFAIYADRISWQIGSILISGVLVALGILSDTNTPIIFFYGGIFVANIILSIWLLFFQSQNQLCLMKLFRVREIEKHFGMRQNYYWEKGREDSGKGIYRTYGLSGSILTEVLTISLITIINIYGMLKILLLKIGIIAIIEIIIFNIFCFFVSLIVIIIYYYNKALIKSYLKKLSQAS
jgi:hypothetical protein